MAIDTSGSVEQFFFENVESACKNQKVEASAAAQSYLAGVLADFVRPEANAALNETLDRPLTLVLDEALQTPPPERFEKLRSLGDGTLYVSGFFGDHFERRGVDDAFVASIGGFAYRTAAASFGPRKPHSGGGVVDVFGELAARFRTFVDVVAEVAERTSFSTKTPTGALRLYEKWLRTGSERLARELVAQGLAPSGRLGTA
jgi:hypothetical protein